MTREEVLDVCREAQKRGGYVYYEGRGHTEYKSIFPVNEDGTTRGRGWSIIRNFSIDESLTNGYHKTITFIRVATPSEIAQYFPNETKFRRKQMFRYD